MKLVIIILMMCISLWASEPMVQIKNFNATYDEPSGLGSVDYLKIKELYNFENKTEFGLEKQASKIILSLPQEDIEIEGIPEFIHTLKYLDVVKLKSLIKENSIDISFDKFSGNTTDMSVGIDQLSLSCFNDTIGESLVLDNCINGTSKFEIEYLLYKTEKETKIQNLSFNIKDNSFNINLKTKGQNIKGNGSITFNKREMQIVIKIDKVKAGFISVKGMVFKELKKIESDKVIVDKPWVTINLD